MIRPYTPREDVKPYYPCVIDIETNPDGSVLAIGFCWETDGERHYETFSDWDSWFSFAVDVCHEQRHKERYRIFYAHNGLGFDWLSFLVWARKNKAISNVRYIYNGGFGIGCTFKLGKRIYHLRDSLRLLPGKLGTICEAFNTDYQKEDLEDTLPHEILRTNPDRFWRYLRSDCLGLQSAIYRFWEIIYQQVGSIDRLPLTLPSLAMKLFRMTLNDSIMTPSGKDQKALERRSYTGGRTECYFSGVANVRVYDVNSEYPFVMLNAEVPTSYHGGFVSEYTGDHGIYEIEYRQTNRELLPVLRDENTKAFQYEGSGVYAKPEIDLFLSVGGELSVISGYVYVDTGNLFRSFVHRWYDLRQKAIREGNSGLAYVAKIMMNSLYGKFGQKETGTTLVEADAEQQEKWLENGTEFVPYGDYCVVSEELRSEYTFVGIASYITSLARVHLYGVLREAQEKGGTVWACDTDSVHVSGAELDTDPFTLGALKLEYSGETAYLGKKLYSQENGTIKAKGVGNPKRAGVTHADMLKIARGEMKSLQVAFPCAPTFREVLVNDKNACQFFERTRTIQTTSPRLPVNV